MRNKLQDKISKPAISRLCVIYRALDEMIRLGVATVSSSQLAERLSMNSPNVRKDISYLGD
ncbi:redox-sensing transcriptional repressor Rex, partial [candidate division KSB1 bacterium]|nr:redox-sensing transcriptional repressor Rex [candidate division KSB1 bacterium]